MRLLPALGARVAAVPALGGQQELEVVAVAEQHGAAACLEQVRACALVAAPGRHGVAACLEKVWACEQRAVARQKLLGRVQPGSGCGHGVLLSWGAMGAAVGLHPFHGLVEEGRELPGLPDPAAAQDGLLA